MITAFVLSGGGSLGAGQVGMLRALVEGGVRPDMIVGSFVGAINGAWLAGRPDPDGVAELERIWTSIGRSTVFPVNPVTGLRGFLGRRDHLVPPTGLERLLRAHLSYARIEAAAVPLHLITTDVRSGLEVVLSHGPIIPALLASAAIPGVFPPVAIDDHQLIDGGVVNNTPISHAFRLGADEVYALPTGYSCALTEPPRSALGMLMHAFDLLIQQRLLDDVEHHADARRLHVIPPLCPVSVSPVDFSQTGQLMARAHAATKRWLSAGGDQAPSSASALRFHDHLP